MAGYRAARWACRNPGQAAVIAAAEAGVAARAAASADAASAGSMVTAITFAEQQLGKPYMWGGTGPDAFDCSGLVMMAYRTAGIDIARTSQDQWATERRIPASQVRPGDLVFFAGSDGTPTSPGHVGLVIGNGKMIEAYATGFPIRVSATSNPFTPARSIGFTQPWAQAGTATPAAQPRRAPGMPTRAPPSLPPHEPLVDRFGGFSTRMRRWRYTVCQERNT